MKLIIQIPCFNEEETLPVTLRDLPTEIEGVDEIETLIIDDGSTDRTVEVARAAGVNHIVRFRTNRGLAHAFRAGLDACLKLGAHYIVNTDADNQYCGADIAKLVRPLVDGAADVVIGDRQVDTIAHFSCTKKMLQKFGSWVVRKASSTTVADTTSGFRAYTRDAAIRMNVVSQFSYTLETIIQAGLDNMAVTSVPIRTNGKLRDSRLFRGIWSYVQTSVKLLVRIYTMYRPLQVFFSVGSVLLLLGVGVSLRYLCYYYTDGGQGHVQSLILSAVLVLAGFQVCICGLLADLIADNRRLIEDTLVRTRKLELRFGWIPRRGVPRA